MLEIIRSLKAMDVRSLMDVYEQSLNDSDDPNSAQQEFYAYLREFLSAPGSYYSVWTEQVKYVSALRVENYQDGVLVTGLETAPAERGKGYAKQLLSAVVSQLPPGSLVYSHIHNANRRSIAVHRTCGFIRTLDHAVYLDGSVSTSASTYTVKAPAH